MGLGLSKEVIVGREVAGSGHEGAPGGLVVFFSAPGVLHGGVTEYSGSWNLMIYTLLYVTLQ